MQAKLILSLCLITALFSCANALGSIESLTDSDRSIIYNEVIDRCQRVSCSDLPSDLTEEIESCYSNCYVQSTDPNLSLNIRFADCETYHTCITGTIINDCSVPNTISYSSFSPLTIEYEGDTYSFTIDLCTNHGCSSEGYYTVDGVKTVLE